MLDVKRIVEGIKNNGTKLSKIIIPVRTYNIDMFAAQSDYEVSIWVLAQHLKRAGVIQDASGYIAAIKSNSCRNIDVFNALREKVGHDTVMVHIGDLKTYVEQGKDLSKFPAGLYFDNHTLANLWEAWTIGCGYDKYQMEKRSDEFFKHIPHIKAVVKPYFGFGDTLGYCCEDCDGPIEQYRQFRFDSDIRETKRKIQAIKFI
jgi:hypothetical protein